MPAFALNSESKPVRVNGLLLPVLPFRTNMVHFIWAFFLPRANEVVGAKLRFPISSSISWLPAAGWCSGGVLEKPWLTACVYTAQRCLYAVF